MPPICGEKDGTVIEQIGVAVPRALASNAWINCEPMASRLSAYSREPEYEEQVSVRDAPWRLAWWRLVT